MATQPTLEKDIDVSGDRDSTRYVDRASMTGSDDKTKTFGASTDLKVDIGEAEAVASGLANATTTKQAFEAALLQQILRQNEAAIRQQEELSVIKQRQLSNAADYDQDLREMRVSHNKSRNSQDVKHADLATDRQWNVDEQGYQATKILEALGVDHRAVLSTMLVTLAEAVKAK